MIGFKVANLVRVLHEFHLNVHKIHRMSFFSFYSASKLFLIIGQGACSAPKIYDTHNFTQKNLYIDLLGTHQSCRRSQSWKFLHSTYY